MCRIIQGVATLIIPVVRFDNIGEYYFNASYTSPATGIKYYAATHTQLSISRKLYKLSKFVVYSLVSINSCLEASNK